MKAKKLLLVFIFLTFLFFDNFRDKGVTTDSQNSTPPSVEGIASDLVLVSRVIDGDTIEIEGGTKVRLIGIDTPEMFKKGETECFGEEAKNYLEDLVSGKMVKLDKDISDTDRYGRLLRYAYTDFSDESDAIFINDILVRNGYARTSTFPPDVKNKDTFLESEKYARDNYLGLWSACQN
jgi:micrococcal nuclease